jgi:hypothetical protein
MANGRSFFCICCLAFATVASFLLVLNLISYQAKLNDKILILQDQTASILETYCADVTFENDVYKNFDKVNKGIIDIKKTLYSMNKIHKAHNDFRFKE